MSGRHIVLVEDDPDDEELTLRALRRAHIASEVVVTHDGQQAVDLLCHGDAPLPAVVLLDLKLPKLDGIDVLQRLRGTARTRALPVVVLTSSSEDADMQRCYAAGANSYVRKPVESGAFDGAVAQLGQYWTEVNEPPPD